MELRTYRNKFLLIDDAQLLQIENLTLSILTLSLLSTPLILYLKVMVILDTPDV